MATTSIFIKSYSPDGEWLTYCLRSIEKFAEGFSEIVVAVPPEMKMDLTRERVVYIKGETPENGYLFQQISKLYADRISTSDYLLMMDSDTIFTSHATPKNYMEGGKVIWMMTPWEKVSTPWQPLVEKFLKKPVAFEFMRRHPFITPRWLLAELRAFCEREHGVTLDSYIMSQPHREFSEFNALGAFAYEFFRDEFVWVNTEEVPPDQWPKLTVLQSWSKGGLTEEIKAKFETILSAVPVLAEPIKGEDPAGLPTARLSRGSPKGEARRSIQERNLNVAAADNPTYEMRQTSDRNETPNETGQTDAETLSRSGMQTVRKPEEAVADQRLIESKISGQMESKDSRSQKQDSETGQMREMREPNQTGRASRRLRETSGSDVAVQNVPQTLTVEDAIARLAVEADRGWFYKKRLEKNLKAAGVLRKWQNRKPKK